MDGEEGLDVSVRLHKVHNGLDLGLRFSLRAMVGLGAGAAAGTRHCTGTTETQFDCGSVDDLKHFRPVLEKTLRPNPVFQFLLGSTPTQLDPGLGFLVLRHIRFCRHERKSSQCHLHTVGSKYSSWSCRNK